MRDSRLKNIISKLPGYYLARKQYRRKWLKNKNTEKIFNDIYAMNRWGNSESISGDGSTLGVTLLLRDQLAITLKELDIRSILDIPCGDFNWMKELDLSSIEYIGSDIVRALVDRNERNYSGNGRSFIHLDIINDELPDADLIFCKDCLVHFSNRDIQLALNNIVSSNATYFAATTFPMLEKNKDIVTGEWRPMNLQKPPFNFPQPIVMLKESNDGIKCLGIWEIKDLVICLSAQICGPDRSQ